MDLLQKPQLQQHLFLSMQMQQALHLLQSDLVDLTAYVKEQSLSNPLFEVQDFGDVLNWATPQAQNVDIIDYLLPQIKLRSYTVQEQRLLSYFLVNLDEHGYLALSPTDFKMQYHLTDQQFKVGQQLLAQLEPAGIGLTGVRTYFLQQLAEQKETLAYQIVQNYWELLIKRQWTEISQRLHQPLSQIKKALHILQLLRRYPYEIASMHMQTTIVPDLILQVDQQHLQLSVSVSGQPRLIFAQETYEHLQNSADLEVRQYVQSKYRAYQSLLSGLRQRSRTLAAVGTVIVATQKDFLLQKEDTLQPLLLRDVATRLHISESTVSRAIKDKYLQTRHGILALKDCFSRPVKYATELSTITVQKRLQALIKTENHSHPFSDQQLAILLQKQGVQLARRTVTKYRQALAIGNTQQRKKA
ncbi:RNA polymerase factor sigma-54 [Bombilactobacillus thymidiniphilus]|uniref:RNA polymerase factor sigma-54 n=1 Tax=Bombilactobacillus thymidiniphilus TaxID=2923363 RepID=A0ABY4PEM3_9LACO|nr:RNA polymerase factor sigma-54 [Bombilactobacillus thymidiniphilus]UQS84085.1 RNA polymerase factor sigma-54 [Bombilactobacillus thymidiniphilus]